MGKNVEFIVRALGERRDKTWPLVWVANFASSAYVERVKALASEMGVVLELRTMVKEEELIDLYRSATLFLYSPRLEPFGLAPLEAAACGLPTIAVREAGVRETIVDGETGILVNSAPEDFARAIDELLANPDKVVRLGEQARANVEKLWSADAAARELEALLSSIAANGLTSQDRNRR